MNVPFMQTNTPSDALYEVSDCDKVVLVFQLLRKCLKRGYELEGTSKVWKAGAGILLFRTFYLHKGCCVFRLHFKALS